MQEYAVEHDEKAIKKSCIGLVTLLKESLPVCPKYNPECPDGGLRALASQRDEFSKCGAAGSVPASSISDGEYLLCGKYPVPASRAG